MHAVESAVRWVRVRVSLMDFFSVLIPRSQGPDEGHRYILKGYDRYTNKYIAILYDIPAGACW